MQDYRRHSPSDDEPWWSAIAERHGVRYERARRLSQFRRDVAGGPRLTMSAAKLRRRRQALERWRDYLDGWRP